MDNFKASVWIHRHWQTGAPSTVELTSISGEGVSMDFLRYMDAHAEDSYVIGRFNQLKLETAYSVLGHYWYEDGEFDLMIDSFVEIIIDDDEIRAIIDSAEHTVRMWETQRVGF